MHAIESYTVDKNSYAMHTIKNTPNLLFEYQCTSGKFTRLPNRNFFLPNWNALVVTCHYTSCHLHRATSYQVVVILNNYLFIDEQSCVTRNCFIVICCSMSMNGTE